MGKIVLIASGKGGVGKSSVAAGLAVAFARQMMRVLLVDADIGLRCLDLLMGIQDRVLFELSDCVEKRCTLTDAAVQHPRFPSLYLMVGGQNVRPGDFGRKELSKIFQTLKKYYDIILIDCPAGLGKGFRNMMQVADEALLVATPDDLCLRDTEKTAAVLFDERGLRPGLVLNRYEKAMMKKGLIRTPEAIGLGMDIRVMGVIPNNRAVYSAMLSGRTMAECGAGEVEESLRNVAARLAGEDVPLAADMLSTVQRFLKGRRGGALR